MKGEIPLTHCLTSSLYWQRNPSGARSGLLGKDQATEARVRKINIGTAAESTVADHMDRMLNAVLHTQFFIKYFKCESLPYNNGLNIDFPSIQINHKVFGSPEFVYVSQKYRSGSGLGTGSSHNQAKIVRKPLISTVLLLLYDFLSVKNDVNIP